MSTPSLEQLLKDAELSHVSKMELIEAQAHAARAEYIASLVVDTCSAVKKAFAGLNLHLPSFGKHAH